MSNTFDQKTLNGRCTVQKHFPADTGILSALDFLDNGEVGGN